MRTRRTRRTWGRGIAPALALAALAGACGTEEPGAADADFCRRVEPAMRAFLDTFPSPSGDRYGGTAVVGGLGDLADGMNALGVSDYGSQQFQVHAVLTTLVEYDDDFRPAPYLAESWSVSEADSTLTFHLRDDVYWQDGVPTTAWDVAFTFRRAIDPETAFPNAGYWQFYDPEVEVPDSFTVRFHVTPHAEMFDAWRFTAIMPRHLLEDVPPAELRRHPFMKRCPVGNGPFRVADYRPEESWTFEASPAFPAGLGGRPYLDRVVYRIYDDQTTALADLLTGAMDVYLGAPTDQVERMRASDAARAEVYPFRSFLFVTWNLRRPPFQDVRVRRALTSALDRREILQGLVGGYGEVINSSVPPFHWAYDPSLSDSLPYDPGRARALLDEAGWRDRDGDGVRENEAGEPFAFTVRYNQGNRLRQDVAEVMQSQLAEVGVRARPRVVEWSTLLHQLDDRDFDAVVMSWIPDFRLDDRDIFHSERIEGDLAWAGLQDTAVDRLIDTLRVIRSREEALPVWREYQRKILELQPYTFLFATDRVTGVSSRLEDVEADARGELLSVRRWWLAEGDAGGDGG